MKTTSFIRQIALRIARFLDAKTAPKHKNEVIKPFVLEDPEFESNTKFYITVSTEKQPEFNVTNTFLPFIEETFWIVNAYPISTSVSASASVSLFDSIHTALIPFVNGAVADFSKLGTPFASYQAAKEFKEVVQLLKDESGLPVYSNVSIVYHSEKVPVSQLKTHV